MAWRVARCSKDPLQRRGTATSALRDDLSIRPRKRRRSGTCWPPWLALVVHTGSVVKAGGGAARHTRAWSVGAPAVVADCRRLRFMQARIRVPEVLTDGLDALPASRRTYASKMRFRHRELFATP